MTEARVLARSKIQKGSSSLGSARLVLLCSLYLMLHITPPKRNQSLINRRRRSRSESHKVSSGPSSSLNKLKQSDRLCNNNSRSTPELYADLFTSPFTSPLSTSFKIVKCINQFDPQSRITRPEKFALNQIPVASLAETQVPLRSSSLHPSNILISQHRNNVDELESEISEISFEEYRIPALDHSFQTVDDDVRESLLAWKRQSVFIDWTRVFGTPRKELFGEANVLFGELETLISASQEERKAEELWHEADPEIRKNMVASCLGRADPYNKDVLRHYIARFEFADMQLDEAFRTICSKLYFRAEAQEIDRVLEAFAHQYWHCNKHGPYKIYGSADIVYAVIYSLMLLNTDLHVIRNGHLRMTRIAFCNNTMSTVLDHLDPLQDFVREAGGLQKWKEVMERMLKTLYSSVKNHGVLQPLEEQSEKPKSLLQRMGSMKQRSTRRESDDESSSTSHSSRSDSRDRDGPCIKGQLLYKKLNDTRQRDMLSCSVFLERGFLTIQGKEKIDLIHTVASLYEETTTLLLEYGEIAWLFECGDQAEKWVRYCNYWAAITSRIPLRQGVNNTEFFGWEKNSLQSKNPNISEWKAPPLPSSASMLDMDTQWENIRNYRAMLQDEYSEHQSLARNEQLALCEKTHMNWVNKKHHLLGEMRKYDCYDKAIAERRQPTRFDTSQPLVSTTMDLFKEINAQLQLTGISIADDTI